MQVALQEIHLQHCHTKMHSTAFRVQLCSSQTRIRRRESQRAAAARKNSHAYAQQLLEPDEVLPLDIYPASSEAAQDVLDSLTSSQLDRALVRPSEKTGADAGFGVLSGAQVGAEVHEYIGVMRATEDTSAVVPASEGPATATSAVQAARAALSSAIQAATSMGAQPGISAAVVALARRESGATAVEAYNLPDPAKVSMGDLRRLPLPIQVGIVMKRAMILPLHDVKRFTREDASDDVLVSHLLQFARPVRGLWVLSSQHWVTLPDALHLLAGDAGLDQRAVRVAYETLSREARENAEEEAAAAAAAAGGSRRRGGGKRPKGASGTPADVEEETDPDAVTVEHPVGLHMDYRPDLLGPIARTTMQGIARLVAVRDYVLNQLQTRGGVGESGVHLAQLQTATGAATSTLRSILKSLGRVRGGAIGPPKHSHVMAVTYGAGSEADAVEPPTRDAGDAAWHLPPTSSAAEAALRESFPGMLAQQEESWERRTAALEALFGQSSSPSSAESSPTRHRAPQASAAQPKVAGGTPAPATAAAAAGHDAQLLTVCVEAARAEIASLLHRHRVCSVRYLASALRVLAIRQLVESGDLSGDFNPEQEAAGALAPTVADAAAAAAMRGVPTLAPVLGMSWAALHLAVASLVRGGSTPHWAAAQAAASEAHVAVLASLARDGEPAGEFIGMNAIGADEGGAVVEAAEEGGALPTGTPPAVAAAAARMAFAAPSVASSTSGRSRDAVIAEFARGALSLQRRQIIAAVDAADQGAGSAMSAGQYKTLMTELATSQRGLGWVRKSGEYDDVPLEWE